MTKGRPHYGLANQQPGILPANQSPWPITGKNCATPQKFGPTTAQIALPLRLQGNTPSFRNLYRTEIRGRISRCWLSVSVVIFPLPESLLLQQRLKTKEEGDVVFGKSGNNPPPQHQEEKPPLLVMIKCTSIFKIHGNGTVNWP